METKIKLTFKPLKRKRFKCNQTGEITKNPELYAANYHNKLYTQKIKKFAPPKK